MNCHCQQYDDHHNCGFSPDVAKHDQQGIGFVEEEAAAPELKVLEARISRLQDCHPFCIWIKISFGSAMFSRIQITLTLPNVIYWDKTASFMISFKTFLTDKATIKVFNLNVWFTAKSIIEHFKSDDESPSPTARQIWDFCCWDFCERWIED